MVASCPVCIHVRTWAGMLLLSPPPSPLPPTHSCSPAISVNCRCAPLPPVTPPHSFPHHPPRTHMSLCVTLILAPYSLPFYIYVYMTHPCAPAPPNIPPHSLLLLTRLYESPTLCFLSVQHILPPAAVVWESSLCMHPSTYLTSSCLLIVFPCCVFVRSLLPYAASQFNGSIPAICMNRPFTISPFLLPSLPHYSQLAYTHSFPFSLPSARRVVSNIFSSSPHFPVPQHTWRLTSPIITVYNPFYLSSQSSSGLIIALCWGSLHLTSIVHSCTSAIYITFLPHLLPLPPFPPPLPPFTPPSSLPPSFRLSLCVPLLCSGQVLTAHVSGRVIM